MKAIPCNTGQKTTDTGWKIISFFNGYTNLHGGVWITVKKLCETQYKWRDSEGALDAIS